MAWHYGTHHCYCDDDDMEFQSVYFGVRDAFIHSLCIQNIQMEIERAIYIDEFDD